jgi:hypothetical protein
MNKKIKPIAIYLPQFHPTPENDEWWGKGFTEWTNVTKAKSLFKGHYQPQLPSDLGFYDLRLEETRIAQAEMAKQYGIEGFSYYHYWFKGKRLIERPFEDTLKSKKPDFPFCLFWANETWSRRWLGEEKEILIKQEYSKEDDQNHADYLANVFQDERYITVNNRPVFIIYRPTDLPNPSETIAIIKETCIKKNGVEPYLVASNSHCDDIQKLMGFGFDQILFFKPKMVLPDVFNDNFLYRRLKRNLFNHGVFDGKLKIYTYQEALEYMERVEPKSFNNIIPCVFVGWDNTARRKEKGIIMKDNTPELFQGEINRVVKKIKDSDENTGLLFINAWNEWAEGNHLEPDHKNGDKFLNCIKNINAK